MSILILNEAKKLNLDIQVLDDRKNFYVISNGSKELIIKETFCIQNNLFIDGITLARNKNITYQLFKKNNIPFPPTFYLRAIGEISKIENKIKFPIIIKENSGQKSENLFVNIRNKQELVTVIEKLKHFKNDLIVQKMVKGREYRILVYKKKVIACLNLIPPHVIGDGMTTIKGLIKKKNKRLDKKIIINNKVKKTLQKNKFSLNMIPKRNQAIYLQENSCLAEGGTSVDCTESIHPTVSNMAIKAVDSVFLDLGGVDMICSDITLDSKKQVINILEVNGRPDISIHHKPLIGKSRNIAGQIFKDYFC